MTAMTIHPTTGTRSPRGRSVPLRPGQTPPAPARPTRRTARPVHRPTAGPAQPIGDVRLTRRGRVVVTLMLLALALVALTLFSAQSAATRESGANVPTRTVVVGEGDTLWQIAGAVAEPGRIRELVHEIQKLNSLPGPALVEGQELAVPVR
jgi:nucleoid-associated protein YgaU